MSASDEREDARDDREIIRDQTYTDREEGRVQREVVRDEALIGREEVRDSAAVAVASQRENDRDDEATKSNERVEKRLGRFIRNMTIAAIILGIACAFSLGALKSLYSSIQKQRYDSLVLSCTQQNKRHNDTVKQVGKFPKKQREGIIVLIDTLQPFVKDCEEEASKRVKGDR